MARAWWASVGVALALFGCGSDDSAERSMGSDPGTPNDGVGSGDNDAGAGGSLGAGGGGGNDLGELPDEEKDVSAFRAPVVTGDFLWFANPDSSRVALINAVTLETRIVTRGGYRPTYVAALPSEDDVHSAIVLNTGSQDATWFRLEGEEISDQTFPTHFGANSWTVAPSGRWAVAWSLPEPDVVLDPTDGLQDITIVDFAGSEPQTHRLTVGYRPSAMSFSADEERLIVVSAPGLSVIDLTGDEPETAHWVDLGGVSGRGVSITPDGEYALVHRSSSKDVEILALDGSAGTKVSLGAPVTDLELSADGSRAVAVLRESRSIAVLELPDIIQDPATFDTLTVPGELFGSVAFAPGGQAAALYTTAVDHSRLVLVDLGAGASYLSYRVVDVNGPVTSVQTTPDGEHAIALMGRAEGSTKPGSFAMVSLRTERFPRIDPTEAPVHRAAVTSAYALITTRDTQNGVFESHLIQMPSGRLDTVRLSSPPTAVGILSERGLGYVAQSHPEGRVSILNFSDAQARTLTGFELAAKVVE